MSISQSKKTSRGGFTLIELLVVIAIIGVLVGLLLPAVQQAREAARRASCTNKMKQMGLAVLNYESTYSKLPAAFRTSETFALQALPTNSGNKSNHRWGFILNLLPFLEQVPLHQAVITKIKTPGLAPWDGALGEKDTELTELLCPSEINGSRMSGTGQSFGRTNYRINRGDIAMNNGGSMPANPRAPGAAGWTGWSSQSYPNNTNPQNITFRNITDGTSNTIMLGEVRIGDNSGDSRQGGWGLLARAGNEAAKVAVAPSACEALIGADGRYTATVTNKSANQEPGTRWTDGNTGYTQFFTHAAPNSARCGETHENWQINPASSYHPGGAVMTHVDGSVKFYSDNIDDGDSTQPQTGWTGNKGYNGKSQRGVIGSLGSMNGGEVIAN